MHMAELFFNTHDKVTVLRLSLDEQSHWKLDDPTAWACWPLHQGRWAAALVLQAHTAAQNLGNRSACGEASADRREKIQRHIDLSLIKPVS